MDVLHIGGFLYYRRYLFSMIVLDARYNWWVVASNTCCSLFLISHLFVLTRITWKLQIIYGRSASRMTNPLSETFFVWFKVTQDIQLESYGTRHTLVVLWCNIVCILQTCAYIAKCCATTHDNRTTAKYTYTGLLLSHSKERLISSWIYETWIGHLWSRSRGSCLAGRAAIGWRGHYESEIFVRRWPDPTPTCELA